LTCPPLVDNASPGLYPDTRTLTLCVGNVNAMHSARTDPDTSRHLTDRNPHAEELRAVAQRTFQENLPKLLSDPAKAYHRKWVAYHGARLVCVAEDDILALRNCTQQGYDATEILVRMVAASSQEVDSDDSYISVSDD
jgi:hypothetical protein